MSPSEHLRWAVAPDNRRGAALLWVGLATLLASGGVLTGIEAPPLLSALLYLVMILSWFAAACGMIGYMRWFFRQTAAEARELKDKPPSE